MLKILKISLLALLAVVTSASCTDSGEEGGANKPLVVWPEQIEFPAEGGEELVTVTCEAVTPEVSCDSAWVKAEIKFDLSQAVHNRYKVRVKCLPNTTRGRREAMVSISTREAQRYVKVSQTFEQDGTITTDKLQVDLDMGGGDFDLVVNSAYAFTVKTPDWITVADDGSRSAFSYTERFTAQPNISYEQRSGEIVFTQIDDTTQTAVVKVSQQCAVSKNALEVAREINVGWNLGNSLEIPTGETSWNNPATTQKTIDGVYAAGFNAVRIPCAWNSYLVEDAEPYTIKPAWIARVKEVVDYCYNKGMYVYLNCHWDGGWLEEHANAASMPLVNKKQRAIWTQIANAFADYDYHLIFAGANEVRENNNWGKPNGEQLTAQQSYMQTFVDAVRATGGLNAKRVLAVQTYCANPERVFDYGFKLPEDPTGKGYLMLEFHCYNPQTYTGITRQTQRFWGNRMGYSDSRIQQEDYFDDLFLRLRRMFTNSQYINIPLVLGEYGVGLHAENSNPTTDAKIRLCEAYYYEYLTKCAKDHGIVPFTWDNGSTEVGQFGKIDRVTGNVTKPYLIEGIMKGAAEGHYPF